MNKKKQYITVLQKQIDLLEDPSFDLEAWKSAAQSRLSNIFGENDPRIRQIHDLKIDYSSWALRDSNSKYKPVETCKKKGRAIVESLIDEIELVGLPDNNALNDAIMASTQNEAGNKLKELVEKGGDDEIKAYLQALNKKNLVSLSFALLKANKSL